VRAELLPRGCFRQADVNAKDNFGMTPLHLAARAGHNKACGFLVSQRCDLAARDAAGRTAEELSLSDNLARIISPTQASARVK